MNRGCSGLIAPFSKLAIALLLLAGLFGYAPPSYGEEKAAPVGKQPPEAGEAKKPAEADKQADDAIKRVGYVFRIDLPITGDAVGQIREPVLRAIEEARAESARPVLIFEFHVPEDQSEFGTGSSFGSAHDLAKFLSSQATSAATTVAYIPQTIQGHAVLVALACDEMIMAPDAEIGPAGVDEPFIDDIVVEAYRVIASRRKNFPPEVAVKLVDPKRELLEVTTDVGVEYAAPEKLEELAQRRTITKKQVLFKAGTPGRFSGVEARRKGFIGYQASDRREAASALELPPGSLREQIVAPGAAKAVRVEVRGVIKGDTIDRIKRMIDDAVRRHGNVNYLIVSIDSAGGSPGDSANLANYLAYQLDPGKVRTIAYIPKQARGDAALVALACDDIVMHTDALWGGDGDSRLSEAEVADMTAVVQEIAKRKHRNWSLPAAMFDSNLEVFRYTKPDRAEPVFFGLKEWSEQDDPETWQRQAQVTEPGKAFSIAGKDAPAFNLGVRPVEDFAQLKAMYNLQNTPDLLEPTWVDRLVDFLKRPGMRVLLLVLGFVALYIELHSPGIGVPAFLGTVFFALFFWSQFGGTAGWLEVILFALGMICLALELFVLPGFGIFGMGGALLVLTSLILASQTFIIPHNQYEFAQFQGSLMTVGMAIVGVIAVIAMVNRWLPNTPVLGQLILQPPSEDEADAISRSESLADYHDLVGQRGTATTPLVPGGKARIGSKVYDVMSDGEFVPRDVQVEVVEVRGNWVVVRPVDGQS